MRGKSNQQACARTYQERLGVEQQGRFVCIRITAHTGEVALELSLVSGSSASIDAFDEFKMCVRFIRFIVDWVATCT